MYVPLFALAVALVAQTDTVAFVDIRVLDVVEGTLAADQTVLAGDGLILEVGPVGEVAVPRWATVVAGAGRVVVPGLIDSHVHVDSLDLPLFLAKGVTAIRELNGSARHIAWREAVAAGSMVGPRMLVSSTLAAGESVRFRHELVQSPERARGFVRETGAAGYDLVKVYDGLEVDVYKALLEAAREEGLPSTGHVPAAVGLDVVLEYGQSVEHAEQIVVAALGHDLRELDRLQGAVEAVAASGVTVTPTLAVQEVLNSQHEPTFADRNSAPNLRFVDAETLDWWRSLRGGFVPRMVEGEPWPVRFLRLQREVVALLNELNVPILLGTDTPNPFMVPGFSVHEELQALVRAGLTPLEALQAATVVPGERLGFDTPTGRVEAGYSADLLVVGGDPLQNLSILGAPEVVLAGGVLYGAGALADMLTALVGRSGS